MKDGPPKPLPMERSGSHATQPLDGLARAKRPQRMTEQLSGSKIVRDEDMPKLEVAKIVSALENIGNGHKVYQALVYLNRARPHDVDGLYDAGAADNIEVRWNRLWVLSSFLARLSRKVDSHDGIIGRMGGDLSSLHIFTKFVAKQNEAVGRLFERLHDPLLHLLFEKLTAMRADARRAPLLVGIIAAVQTGEERLRQVLADAVGESLIEEDDAEALIGMLNIEAPEPARKRTSTASLGANLSQKLRDLHDEEKDS